MLPRVSRASPRCSSSRSSRRPAPSPPVPPQSPSAKPVDPDQVVFRVTWEGGFVTPESLLARLPIIVVYADGRVITQGPQIDIYPGPMLPNLQEHTLSADALARLVQLARDKDLLQTVHYPFPGVADVPDTVLEINLDGKSYRVERDRARFRWRRVERGRRHRGPSRSSGLHRRADRCPGGRFRRPGAPVHVHGRSGSTRARPSWFRTASSPASSHRSTGRWRTWPRPACPVANSPLDIRCQIIDGDDLAKVLPLLETANSLSTFRSEGELYSFTVRPLLPGEAGC